MSTSTTLRIPLSIPSSLQGKANYTVQISVRSVEHDSEVFIDKHFTAGDLRATSDGSMVASLGRSEIPRFRDGRDVELRAHFWKGERLVESIECAKV
jgi:hypothetical protein